MSADKLLTLVAMVWLAGLSASAQEPSTATESAGFSGYADAPAFSVVPRKDELEFYPCKQCHEFMQPDATVRELRSPHEITLEHGADRFWCLACHHLENRNALRSAMGEAVDFEDAYLVCGGCHANRQKDWYYGAHGKRVANWRGQRQIYNCTHCHNAHKPGIEPRAPKPSPGVRAGLERADRDPHKKEKLWERHPSQEQSAASDEQ